MFILEAIPWLLSFAMLGAMAYLARAAFQSGEGAGRPDIHLPPPPAEPPAEE
ncbi:MAG: hypothetical protein IT299_06675 [Dehalococcoidia bacterium]|nr:hypothetical protein [Dehalococcoidia bacterium]